MQEEEGKERGEREGQHTHRLYSRNGATKEVVPRVRLPNDCSNDGASVNPDAHLERWHLVAVTKRVRVADARQDAEHRKRGVDHCRRVLLRLAAVGTTSDAVVCIPNNLHFVHAAFIQDLVESLRGEGRKETKGRERLIKREGL